MTTQDYILLARSIRNLAVTTEVREDVAWQLSVDLRREDPTFSAMAFLGAATGFSYNGRVDMIYGRGAHD